jgi:ParB/RepB/Spo0J family partition protein
MDANTTHISEILEISPEQQDWWTEDNGHGFVDPKILIPDPDQPRQHIDEEKLHELTGSIEEVGVLESLTVTPVIFAPWVKFDKEKYQHGFFIIVSGHRRHIASILAKTHYVPVRVRVYKNEDEHRRDADLLNENREDLTPLEQAFLIRDRVQKGQNPHQIAKEKGWLYATVLKRLKLTRLAPNIQKLLDPRLKPNARLALSIAEELGGVAVPTMQEVLDIVGENCVEGIEENDDEDRRFFLQNFLLKRIKEKKMSAVKAVEFIQSRAHDLLAAQNRKGWQGGAGERWSAREKLQPRKRLAILLNLLNSVTQSVVFDWKPEEFVRITVNFSLPDIEEIISNVKEAIGCLTVVLERLKSIKETKEKDKKIRGISIDDEMVFGVPYYDREGIFISKGTVTFSMYIRLWEECRLKWLKDNTNKPQHLPSLEEARKKSGF